MASARVAVKVSKITESLSVSGSEWWKNAIHPLAGVPSAFRVGGCFHGRMATFDGLAHIALLMADVVVW